MESQLAWGDPDDPLPWDQGRRRGGPSISFPRSTEPVSNGGPLPRTPGLTVCSVEDFIALECFAGRPQELADIANLIGVRPDLSSPALRVSGAYGLSEDFFLFWPPLIPAGKIPRPVCKA